MIKYEKISSWLKPICLMIVALSNMYISKNYEHNQEASFTISERILSFQGIFITILIFLLMADLILYVNKKIQKQKAIKGTFFPIVMEHDKEEKGRH